MRNYPRLVYYLGASMRRLYWDRRRLKKYQEKHLRSVVKYAYDYVPFYHDWFKKARITPSDVMTLEDLNKIPLVSKAVFRAADMKRLISARYDLTELRPVRTSGSTGMPFKTFIDRREDDWRKAIYMRANISCGHRPRDKWVVITSPHHFGDTAGIQRILSLFAQTCVSALSTTEEQAKIVLNMKPDVLDGYSGSILLLAKAVENMGLKGIHPRIVFGNADLIDRDARGLIERVFGAPFYDQFGCAEVNRTAWQCPTKNGYHMDVDSVVTQFVDTEGEEVSAGETGQIVYTSLFNYAQPLIRYSIGDLGRPSNEECPCGRSLPLMQIVEGRSDSFLVLPDNRLIPPMGFWSIMRLFDFADMIDQFKVLQKKMNVIEIYVKKRNAADDETFVRDRLVAHIRKCLKLADDSRPTFEIVFVDELPREESGKLRSVVSLVNGGHLA